jgi:hypothetical protein
MSKVSREDKKLTKELLYPSQPVVENRTWLRHKADGESGLIDLMILRGDMTIQDMVKELSSDERLKEKSGIQWEKRIKDHIAHLSTVEGDSRNQASGQGGHDLPITITPKGIVRFDL